MNCLGRRSITSSTLHSIKEDILIRYWFFIKTTLENKIETLYLTKTEITFIFNGRLYDLFSLRCMTFFSFRNKFRRFDTRILCKLHHLYISQYCHGNIHDFPRTSGTLTKHYIIRRPEKSILISQIRTAILCVSRTAFSKKRLVLVIIACQYGNNIIIHRHGVVSRGWRNN